jgi:hypothetical protein
VRPPRLHPARKTKAKTANTNARLNERNLTFTPDPLVHFFFLWIFLWFLLTGKAQARELWDHSKQKKFAVVSGGGH